MPGKKLYKWKFYHSAKSARAAMIRDIESATKSIDLEQYIFTLDGTGKKFLELLTQKARSGVTVRMLIDARWRDPHGLDDFKYFSDSITDILKRAGVKVVIFNPISPWRLYNVTSWYFRDHKKILIIDGKIAYTGGSGISDFNQRDTNVRIEGPVLGQIQYAFDKMWTFVTSGKFSRLKKLFYEEYEFAFITNSPRYRQRHFYRELLLRLRRAHTRAWFITPYFVPDIRFLRTLLRKAREGLDVRLLIPTATDHPWVDQAGRSYFALLMKAGVRVFIYPDFIHAKNLVIDDWSSVGSFNLDGVSFFLAHEANLCSTDSKFTQEVAAQCLEDMQAASELGKLAWRNRPLFDKIRELVTWPIHRFL